MAKHPELPPFSPELLNPDGTYKDSVLRLLHICGCDNDHTHHVTFLALRLFDELQPMHRLDEGARALLQYAALLHDIGWIEGEKGHHLATLRIILNTPLLHFTNKERLMIGSIARYHRRALPDKTHDHYAALSSKEQSLVSELGGLLRLADALDASHAHSIQDVTCEVRPRKVVLHCMVQKAAPDEEKMVQEKGDLFELTYKHRLEVQWVTDKTPQKSRKTGKKASGDKGKPAKKKKENPKAEVKSTIQDEPS